jgi:RNA polymerase sigma-54 factor
MLSILDSEDKAKPYTDEQLAELLQEKGFPISRRTVAKYRDKLGIETASKRKNI